MKFWRVPLDLGTVPATRGRVVVIEERCKGCEYCIAFCPREVLRMSRSFNPKGYHFPEVGDESQCVNCHFCEVLCPEFAIFSLENSLGN